MKKAKAVFKSGRFLRTAAVLARGTAEELARGLKEGELGLTDNGALVTKQDGEVVPASHEGSRVAVDMTGAAASVLVNVTKDMDGKVVVLENLPASVTTLTIMVAASVAVVDVTLPTGTGLATLDVVDGEGHALATEKDGPGIPGEFWSWDRFQFNVSNGVLRVLKIKAAALPPYTLRFRASQSVTAADFSKEVTLTPVDQSRHIYDLYRADPDWSILFSGRQWLVDVIDANLDGVTTLSSFLSGASNIETLRISSASTLSDMNMPTGGNSKLKVIHLGDFSACTNVGVTFQSGLTALEEVYIEDLSSMTSLDSTFTRSPIRRIHIGHTSSLTDISYTFKECSELEEVPDLDVSNVTTAYNAFRDCRNVKRGALALYKKLSALGEQVTGYTSAFLDCGADTATGLAELQQIPTSWGGLAE